MLPRALRKTLHPRMLANLIRKTTKQIKSTLKAKIPSPTILLPELKTTHEHCYCLMTVMFLKILPFIYSPRSYSPASSFAFNGLSIIPYSTTLASQEISKESTKVLPQI
jgi:hypothetical protein